MFTGRPLLRHRALSILGSTEVGSYEVGTGVRGSTRYCRVYLSNLILLPSQPSISTIVNSRTEALLILLSNILGLSRSSISLLSGCKIRQSLPLTITDYTKALRISYRYSEGING